MFLGGPASDLPAVFVEVFFVLDFLGRAQGDSGTSVSVEAMSSVELSTS